MKVKRFLILMFMLLVVLFSLDAKVEQGYRTDNVIIAVMDGTQ